jgi:hypothetical protein
VPSDQLAEDRPTRRRLTLATETGASRRWCGRPSSCARSLGRDVSVEKVGRGHPGQPGQPRCHAAQAFYLARLLPAMEREAGLIVFTSHRVERIPDICGSRLAQRRGHARTVSKALNSLG